MIIALAVILGCQLGGEALARATGAPVPGPVIGMVLLFALLAIRSRLARMLPAEVTDGALDGTARGLLAHLSVLFVPAGVGVIQRLDVLGKHGVALAVALVVSTVLGIVAAALAFRAVARWTETGGQGGQ